MKLGGIFRFELAYQLRRAWPWLYLRGPARLRLSVDERQRSPTRLRGLLLNSPFVIANTTVVGCLLWLLIAARHRRRRGGAGRGDADASPRVHAPGQQSRISRRAIPRRPRAQCADPAAVQAGHPARRLRARLDPELIGPFRPAAYLAAYGFIALPNAFIATAIQFSFAALSRPARWRVPRQRAALLHRLLRGAVVYCSCGADLATLMDPIGVIAHHRRCCP